MFLLHLMREDEYCMENSWTRSTYARILRKGRQMYRQPKQWIWRRRNTKVVKNCSKNITCGSRPSSKQKEFWEGRLQRGCEWMQGQGTSDEDWQEACRKECTHCCCSEAGALFPWRDYLSFLKTPPTQILGGSIFEAHLELLKITSTCWGSTI